MEPTVINSAFDIFEWRPLQSSIVETIEEPHKPVSGVDQCDVEFSVPATSDLYIDPNMKVVIRGKLTKTNGTDLDESDFTGVTNNLLHSLFSQCTITINGETVTPAADHYNYRAYLETLLSYGSDATESHLTNSLWYLDNGDLLPCDPSAETIKNMGFYTRWKRVNKSKEIQLCGRLHSDICNVPRYLPPGVRIHIRLTKAKPGFYLMNKDPEAKVVFKFLDAQLLVNRVRSSPSILVAHEMTFGHDVKAQYNMTRVELKTFTCSGGSQSLSIDNAVLGLLPKRLLFTMVKNSDFLGSMATNPYNLRHYDINYLALHVNGKQIPAEGLSFDMEHDNLYVMGYRTLFEGAGIHHSNSGLNITPYMYRHGYFLLLFDLTPDRAASEGHSSLPTTAISGSTEIRQALAGFRHVPTLSRI